MSIASADVQEMLDEYALRKLVHGYSRAVDRGDLDTLRSLYHPDAQDSHGSFSSGSVDAFLRTLARLGPISGRCNTTSPQRTSPSVVTSRKARFTALRHTRSPRMVAKLRSWWAGAISTNTKSATAPGNSRRDALSPTGRMSMIRPLSTSAIR